MANTKIRTLRFCKRVMALGLALLLTPIIIPAQQSDSLLGRNKLKYNEDRLLVYEGAQDLWPYSFLNEKGEADGFNVELVKLILERLDIPFEIKMKPRLMAFQDLKEGRSDLMIGLTAGFHEEYGHYSENTVTLFTQSVLSPRSKPTEIRNFRDLGTHKVIVNDSSLCHHLMVDYGWGANAIPTHNIGETILQMSVDDEGELVWNTLSLKWLLTKFHIENLEITPINMPHGEYKFMSGDEHLIHLMDSVFSELNATDELTPLYNRWFYPERMENTEVAEDWQIYTTIGLAVLLLLLLVYTITYQLQARRITRENNRSTRRLALILETGGVRVWTYDIVQKMFTWRNEYGQPAYIYSPEEFATRYSPEDYEQLTRVMDKLAATSKPADGQPEEEITLDIRAKDAREDGDTEVRDFVISLSVLSRDRQGRPTVLIGTKRDVTEKCEQQRKADERTLRYKALFDTPVMAILFFDGEGVLTELNGRACEMYCCDRDEILQRRMTMADLLGLDGMDVSQADGFYCSLIMDPDKMPEERKANCACHLRGKVFCEFRLMNVYDDGQLLGCFAICRDMTRVSNSLVQIRQSMRRLDEVRNSEKEYIDTINDFIRNGNVRLVEYSPTTHTLVVQDANSHVQHQLTQTRIMTLVEPGMRKKIMHIIDKMDDRQNITIDTDIRTSLRIHGKWLCLHLHLLPQTDKNGTTTLYLGILTDISDLKDVQKQLNVVEAKTQEVEHAKNTFVKNMMQEIRLPMTHVIDSAGKLSPTMAHDAEAPIIRDIIGNADQLTHIISNVLNLSRIEANMVEIVNRPTDLAQVFQACCENGWEKNKRPEVVYTVEDPYDQLVVDIDVDQVSNIIRQLTLNAAQHTQRGMVRARYDYIGRRLFITIEDTGEGMSRSKLAELNAQLANGTHTSSGLGLPICKELLSQMGGSMEISSELGMGTTVWIMLPCNVTEMKRKKMAS